MTLGNLQTHVALIGRVAVVTGARRGIGYCEALALAQAGAKVVVVAHEELAQAERVAAEIRTAGGDAFAARADITSSDQVRALVAAAAQHYGRLDILVNNAGMNNDPQDRKKLVDISEESWDRTMAGHLKGTFLCIKYAAPIMMEHRWGRIINTSSIHGRIGGRPGVGHYGAAKAGIIALTRTAARELGPFGITVNAVAPGFIATDRLLANASPRVVAAYQSQNPLGRMGKPEEVANLVVFLASEGAAYINGAVIDCTGGRMEYCFENLPTE